MISYLNLDSPTGWKESLGLKAPKDGWKEMSGTGHPN